MTPSASSSTISPTLEPTQESPKRTPERMFSRQRRRKWRLSGVSSYMPATIVSAPATAGLCGRYKA
jgi:hypothetical protein